MILGLALATMLAAAPAGFCAAGTDAGWVMALPAAARAPPASARATHTAADGTTRPLEPAQRLCEGDVVRNPQGSGVTARLRIGGRIVDRPPGSPPYRVERPHWLEAAGDRASEIVHALNRLRRRPAGLSVTGVRGWHFQRSHGVACEGLPPLAGEENWVTADAVARLTWVCDGRPGRFRVEVLGDRVLRREGVETALAIDVRKDCPSGCTVAVWAGRQPVLEARLRVVGADRLPPTISGDFERGGAAKLVAGLRLLDGRPAWRLLGASLVWESACEIPAAAELAAHLYEVTDPEVFCRPAPVLAP